ncbi:aldehyde dehydrogenase family protein [Corynebacterium lubricantis]|uniref:aldehyde dehydrogenase family protein n=1 Tax=Corynebacterium lubricantis TaxID=541095 RepID=UPI000379FC25|nr:aldehyde dehydrogenase family protein [Corynebacterium lubricantis]
MTLTRSAALPYTHVDDFYIGGHWVSSQSDARSDVTDPATGEVWGSVPVATEVEINAAVESAAQALDDWSTLSAAQRAEFMGRMADEIELRAENLALTNSRENGSPTSETLGAAKNAAGILRYFSTLAGFLDGDDVRPFPAGGAESIVDKDPIGVCALIAPWNFPINLVVIKLAPALLAGCTVVIKPASPTPLSIRFIVDAAAAAGIPGGVINLITGPGRMGDTLVRHPKVAKVAFTGSTGVGKKIAAACGENLKPVTLELGGKSSAIVMPDVDLDAMSKNLIRTCLRNTGQTCYISTRILAPASRYDEVVDMVADTIASAKQGDPMESDTVFGPIANKPQYDTVVGYLDSAKSEGARFVTGGDKPADLSDELTNGYFLAPTVLADVTPDMTVAKEEIFGPVLTILKYDDSDGTYDEAIELANNTEFGLGGVVFGSDESEALKIARRVDSGSVGINFFGSNHSAPFAGRHDSGLGAEYGIEGLSAYLTYKSIHRRTH